MKDIKNASNIAKDFLGPLYSMVTSFKIESYTTECIFGQFHPKLLWVTLRIFIKSFLISIFINKEVAIWSRTQYSA